MEEENDLGMGLFGDLDGIQLNTDYVPEEEIEDLDPLNQEEETEEEDELENRLDEDDSSEEVVEDEENDEGEDNSDQDDNSPNIYSSFASVLSEQGLLPSLDLLKDQKIETVDDLATVFKSEINNQVKEYLLSKVGEEGYDALEKGISLAEYQQYQDNVLTLEGISEDVLAEDLELSKKIIYQDYLSQGLSEKRAQAILKKSIDLGEEQLLEDAKSSLESLKEVQAKQLQKTIEERQAQQSAEIAEQEKIDNDLKNTIYNAKEIVPGLKLNKTIQDRVYNSITKVVGKGPNGVMENQLMRDRRENPVDFDAKLYYLYEVTKGFKDFSAIVSKSESKAVSKLEAELRKTKFNDSSTPSYLSDPNSYGGIGSELVI